MSNHGDRDQREEYEDPSNESFGKFVKDDLATSWRFALGGAVLVGIVGAAAGFWWFGFFGVLIGGGLGAVAGGVAAFLCYHSPAIF